MKDNSQRIRDNRRRFNTCLLGGLAAALFPNLEGFLAAQADLRCGLLRKSYPAPCPNRADQ
mgnify:CR=1 FL=1